MLDLVFLAMFLIVPWLVWSIRLVKVHRRYALHKRMQLMMAAILFVTVVLFEIDMRVHGWRDRALPSPYWREGSWNDPVDYSLGIHLLCAIPNLLVWAIVIFGAWRHFPHPIAPNAYSPRHRVWGRTAAYLMGATAITGWIFYYLAFVATTSPSAQ